MCCPYKERIVIISRVLGYFAAMVNQAYGSGAFQVLLQAVPCTALVCAATIALLLLLVRILAQNLGGQHRLMQEDSPRLHPAADHFPHHRPTRELDPYWNHDWKSPPFARHGAARALDFMNSSSASSSPDASSGLDSFNSSPRMHYKSNLTETLSIEVVNLQIFDLLFCQELIIFLKGGFQGT